MTKTEFLGDLKHLLRELPESDAKESLEYYGEIINDRIEDGVEEADAVSALGTPKEIAEQILSEFEGKRPSATREKRSGMRPWIIVMLIVGSPIWLSLAVTAAALAITAFVLLWTMVAVAWFVCVSLCASAVTAVIAGFSKLFLGSFAYAILLFGTALFISGITILSVICCIKLTAICALLIKKLFAGISSRVKRKEAAA